MTRKPSVPGPTAEDISRHEEEVAAFLARWADDLADRWAGLRTSDKLATMLGMTHGGLAVEMAAGKPHHNMLKQAAWLTRLLVFQLNLEAGNFKTS